MPAGRPIGSPNKKKIKEPKGISREEYLEIKAENVRKLEEILTTPDYMEILGRKYYGDRWFTVLPEGHYKRKERFDKLRRGEIKVTGYIDREIIQMDLDGNPIDEFPSARAWAEETGNTYSAAQHIAKSALGTQFGGRETAYGFRWRFKDNDDE